MNRDAMCDKQGCSIHYKPYMETRLFAITVLCVRHFVNIAMDQIMKLHTRS